MFLPLVIRHLFVDSHLLLHWYGYRIEIIDFLVVLFCLVQNFYCFVVKSGFLELISNIHELLSMQISADCRVA